MQKILKIASVDNPRFTACCQAYTFLLTHWNSITNLVSTGSVDNLLTKLIRQSVAPLAFFELPPHARILDVGSGAGIPALPLKFAHPDLQLTLLEPRRMKWLFLRRVVEELQLEQVEVVRGRLEEVTGHPEWQNTFDLITTRGTGPAAGLFPRLMPLLKAGGMCWFYKGLAARREAAELARNIHCQIRVLEMEKNFNLLVVQP